jgi:flagellar assembly protein FliH
MSMSQRYRDFGRSKPPAKDAEDQTLEALEDHKLQAFEAGYQAGWDDSAKAQADARDKIGAELGQNLQEMSFSYHEALSKLTVSMEPVMTQMIEKLLPELLRNALSAHILEQIRALITEHARHPIEIVVSEKNVDTVKAIAGRNLTEPFEVVGEPTLGEGQAFVRMGEAERQVDLDGVVSGISKAMVAFFHETEQETDHE